MKTIALFYLGKLYPVHLRKDVGLFPLYLKRNYFDEADIIKTRGGDTYFIRNKHNQSFSGT